MVLIRFEEFNRLIKILIDFFLLLTTLLIFYDGVLLCLKILSHFASKIVNNIPALFSKQSLKKCKFATQLWTERQI